MNKKKKNQIKRRIAMITTFKQQSKWVTFFCTLGFALLCLGVLTRAGGEPPRAAAAPTPSVENVCPGKACVCVCVCVQVCHLSAA